MTTSPVLIAGRYRLDVALASGGMGVVWRGWDERLERAVAIKQLRLQPGLSAADTVAARDRSLREARLTARLHHPNAVPIYDVVEHDGEPCLIMQFLPSVSLQATLQRRSTLPLADVARIGSEIASALTAAHRVGIIHRDVKPGNVLLAEDGAAKLTDFGISHAMGDTTLTSTGMVTGTPAYLAPEVARGESATFASDVFSLGATLYTASEGTPPFEPTDNPMALLHRVASGHVRPPTRSGALTPLLTRMLNPDPRARPTMTQAWVDLTSLHASLATSGAGEPTTTQLAATSADRSAATRRTDGAGASAAADRAAAAGATAPVGRKAAAGATAAGAAGLAAAGGAGLAAAGAADSATPRDGANRPPSSASAAGSAPARMPDDERIEHRGRAAGIAAALVALAAIVAALVYFVPTLGGGSSKSGGATTSSTSSPKTPAARATTSRPARTTASTGAPSPTTTPSATPSTTPSTSPSATASTTSSATLPATRSTAPSSSPNSSSQTRSATGSASTTASTAPKSTSAAPTTASVTSASQPGGGGTSSAQLAQAVTDYYALMPGDLNTGYSKLTATYQRDHAGGFSGYRTFWGQFASVSTSNVVAQTPNGATATIIYRYKSGRTVSERTHFRFQRSGGQLLIADSNLVG